MNNIKNNKKENAPVLLYVAEDGKTEIEVSLEGETVWLSQAQMAELFQKDRKTITEHIKNIYEEGELERNPTIRNFRIVQKEGNRAVSRDIEYYNLDVIISVGYLHQMLGANKLEVLADKGKISHEKMEKVVKEEVRKFIERKQLK